MKKRLASICALLFMATCLIYACAGPSNYGVLGPASGTREITIAELKFNWKDYDIYYNGWHTATPAAMMFDPKDNDTTLTGSSWNRVTEESAFLEALDKITKRYFLKQVYAILGPERQLLGYMITPTTQMTIKEIDEKTYRISNLHIPPSGP